MTYDNLKASDGTGNAVLAHIESNRAALATVINVDSVDNWPNEFIVTTGTLLGTGFLDPDTQLEFEGHLSAGDIIIDSVMPGYTDVGNTTGQVAFIKPTTGFADNVVALAKVSHNADGTIKNDTITTPDQFADPVDPALRMRESEFDYIASGCVLTGTGYGSTLAWSLTAGVVYINGKRYTVAAATGVVVASKDTYFDLLEPVSGNVATLVYTGGNSVANNAASPALAANSVRLGIIVSGANIANVAAINQGQVNKILPIVVSGSYAYAVTDSLGNLICPRDPRRKLLGYHDFKSANATASLTAVQCNGLTMPIIIPKGRRAKITLSADQLYMATGGAVGYAFLYDGTIAGAGTQIARASINNNTTANVGAPLYVSVIVEGSPTADTPKVFSVGIQTSNAGRPVSIEASSTSPTILTAEIV